MTFKHPQELRRPSNLSPTSTRKRRGSRGSGNPIHIPRFEEKMRPGNDFYHFVNARWMKEAKIPAHLSIYSVSEEIESALNTCLEREMRASMTFVGRGGHTAEEKARDAVGRMALSALQPQAQRHNIATLKKRLERIASFRTEHELFAEAGHMCRDQIPTFLRMSVEVMHDAAANGVIAAARKPSNWRVSVLPGSAGLPDLGLYSDKATLHPYVSLVQRLCKELDVEDCSRAVPLEAKYFKEIDALDPEIKTVVIRSMPRTHSAMLHIFLESYGVDGAAAGAEIESLKSFFQTLENTLKSYPFEDWKALLMLHTALHAFPYLPPPYDSWHHRFFQKDLEGQQAKDPQEILALETIKEVLPSAMGRLFLETGTQKSVKTGATKFVKSLCTAAQASFDRLTWLSPEGKRKAKEKLEHMTTSVAYSEGLLKEPVDYAGLTTDSFLENVYKAQEAQTAWNIERLTKSTPPDTWLEPPYTVNAFYSHTTNEIIMPAGSLQWPFYHSDHGRWRGWNYGGLGAMVAHEIVHAFDPEDAKEYKWPARNVQRLEQKTKAVIRLYTRSASASTSAPPLNSYNSKYENLSDIGGMSIALNALLAELAAAGATAEERLQQIRHFFVAYAVSWRTKEAKGAGRFATVHAPAKYRVNVVVPQFQEWYDAFCVRPDDALYLAPEKRVLIY